jgi:hypothetical protein
MWETLSQMIGIRGFLVLRQMARRTIRQYAILAPDKGFVAALAFHSGVRTKQWKEIHMVADLLLGSEPALHDVALGAIRAELTQMNIGMAIGAILADIGEERLGVALCTGNSFVSASKRKLRLIMVELRNITNWTPASSRMAIFARSQHRTVWVWSCAALGKNICCI